MHSYCNVHYLHLDRDDYVVIMIDSLYSNSLCVYVLIPLYRSYGVSS